MLFRSNDMATTEIYTPSNTLSLHDALPILLLAVVVLAGCGDRAKRHADRPPFTPQSEPARAAAPLLRGRYLTARLLSPTALRDRPRGRALHRLGVRTEFGSRRVLGVTARRGGWLAAVASERPNGRVGGVLCL